MIGSETCQGLPKLIGFTIYHMGGWLPWSSKTSLRTITALQQGLCGAEACEVGPQLLQPLDVFV